MTGFGRGEYIGPLRAYVVEAQSLNHRYLEVRARLPRRLTALEHRTIQEVQRRFARGRVELTVTERDLGQRARTLKVDRALAGQYLRALQALGRELGVPGEITLDLLVAQRDVLALEEPEEETEAAWEEIRVAVARALDALEAMRRREGDLLEREILAHLAQGEEILSGIAARAPALRRADLGRLRERVAELLDGPAPEAGRLEQELAFLAERSDIAEECARLRSHWQQFREILAADEPQGRRLDFLLQEMNREVNTIGSKSSDAATSQAVVLLKAALEKVREQIQNVE